MGGHFFANPSQEIRQDGLVLILHARAGVPAPGSLLLSVDTKPCYDIPTMSSQETQNPPPRPRKFPLRRLLVGVILVLVALWFVHPPVLARLLRYGLDKAAAAGGFQVDVDTLSVRIGRPIVLENLRLRALDAAESRTAADAGRITIGLNWPWQAFFGPKRLIRDVVVEDLRSVWDFRSEAMPPPVPLPSLDAAEARAQAAGTLQLLPETMTVRRAGVEVLADDQLYFLENFSAHFSEQKASSFSADGGEIQAGPVRQTLGPLEGITAWKGGTLYLADWVLLEGIKVENFQLQLARPGGLALALEAAVYQGSLRMDASFGVEKGLPSVDAAISASNVDAAPVAALLGLEGQAEGMLREGRLTFRGVPDRLLDGQASLLLATDGFLWNKRGWETLEVAANLIHRRLVVNNFELRQKDNTLTGNGEVSLQENWQGLAKAPFLLNLSASLKDLKALSALVGPPFEEMSGRMSLSSSITGQDGRLDGFLSLEASQMTVREHPVESGRVEVTFVHNEAQVTQCEFWSGEDYLRGKGSVAVAAPHAYSGEIQGRLEDMAVYLNLMPASDVPTVYGGAVQVRWQGDGTVAAHSGAFQISLNDFLSEHTPSGLTGRFAGTYSPQNVHFSGLEVEQGALRFSTQATLAGSGVKLRDAVLRAGGRDVLDAELFLPINPFALLAGKSLKEAVLPEKEVYASVTTRGALGVRDLLRLAGNDLPAEGTIQLNLQGSGKPASLTLDGSLQGRGLALRQANQSTPVTQFDATLKAADGMASLNGTLTPRSLPALTLQAETPFGFLQTAEGDLRWMNPEGKLSARLQIPRTNLEIFRPFLPSVRQLTGTLAGEVVVGGTVGQPTVTGGLSLTGGRIQTSTRDPVIDNLNGRVKFDTTRAVIESFSGDIAAGPFALSGGVTFADFADPQYDLTLTGQKILLARDPGLRLRANVDLRASGNAAGGAVTGSVRLVDGRVYQRLEITPLLAPSPVDDAFFVPPRFDGLVPAPFAGWTLDVAVKNETPFTLVGNLAAGEIIPNLRLTGTLGRPFPLGRIELKDARAFLPFTTMDIANGRIDFIESDPWMPQLDVRATTETLDYDIQAFAFGPINERRLILRSDPPLPQEALILLLTAGLPPGAYAGAGFGEAAVGQGGLLLLRAFTRQFEHRGVDVDSLINRLQISSVPPEYQGGRATLRGRFRLWQGLSLMTERDSFGFYNAGATYTLRFK